MTTSTKPQFSLPQINLNGTSPETLFDEYIQAYHLVNRAYRALQSCTCHGRDFQNNSENFVQASFERSKILADLDDAIDYCQAWIETAEAVIES